MANKPNFIIIYTDDLGYGELGCFGSKEVLTPNLDHLATEGVRFTDWYSNSPVCSPSRASLMTGRYPIRTGAPEILGGDRHAPGIHDDESTIADGLRQLGYRTAITGKWHLGVEERCRPYNHGFDEFFGFLAGCVDYYSHIFYWGVGGGQDPVHDLWQNEKEIWNNGKYLTELITDKACGFIERHDDNPFFLYVPYNAPHYPMHAPKKYMDRFAHLPHERQVMSAMISAVDDGVGEIVKTLKKTDNYENTMIFFSSDNGPCTHPRNWLNGNTDLHYAGDPGPFRGFKGSLFDGGIRMPAIMSWPARIPGNQTCREVGAMMDIFPTIIEAADGSLPTDHVIDGKSVLAMVTEGAKSPHKQLFWEYHKQLAVRQGKWKLVLDGKLILDGEADPKRYTPPPAVQLSNMDIDCREMMNFAEQEPELVRQMSDDVRAWWSEISGIQGA